jgi:hypothetical protein
MKNMGPNDQPAANDVTLKGATATVTLGANGAMIPVDTPQETQNELRRLLLAEDAMLNVAEWAREHITDGKLPIGRQARTVSAAGLAAMFCRPFTNDNKRKRLNPNYWRALIADDPVQADMFDRILLRRDKVLAHVDTDAAVVNVTNSYRMFERPQVNDPIVLRVYDVGADGGLLEPESLQLIAGLADRLALLMSHRMANLGATRRPGLMPRSEPSSTQ